MPSKQEAGRKKMTKERRHIHPGPTRARNEPVPGLAEREFRNARIPALVSPAWKHNDRRHRTRRPNYPWVHGETASTADTGSRPSSLHSACAHQTCVCSAAQRAEPIDSQCEIYSRIAGASHSAAPAWIGEDHNGPCENEHVAPHQYIWRGSRDTVENI